MSFRPKSDESLKSPLGTLASEIAIPTAGFDKGWPERAVRRKFESYNQYEYYGRFFLMSF